jgi:hypothetical protein
MWQLKRPDKFETDRANNRIAKHFTDYIKRNKIQAVKFFGLTIDFWLNYDFFKDAKFIRTTRNPDNVAESMIAKRAREKGPAVNKQLYIDYLNNYTTYLDMVQNYDHIYVEFENMQTQPEVQAKRIAEFLGIKHFSTKPVDNSKWHFRPQYAE